MKRRRSYAEKYAVTDHGHATPCWVWLCNMDRGDARTSRSHRNRAAYERRHGAIPEGMRVGHLCGIRACINPDHMELVSQAAVIQRSRRAKLTPELVRAIRDSDDSVTSVGREFGIDPSHVTRIRQGRRWGNVS